ncbi:MAG: bifunctional proline dehydrogenase/L-glutamate gamma-semialdehyde dehydrogenase PutA, partial [Alphaproteobacteria bacterium]
ALIAHPNAARSRSIPPPAQLYGAARLNSRGVEFGDGKALRALLADVEAGTANAPRDAGEARHGQARALDSPIDGRAIGTVYELSDEGAQAAVARALSGFSAWSMFSADHRASILERLADRLEANRGMLLSLLAREAGKTLDDALAELREAVDFCRFYASEARRIFGEPVRLPGPTGEDNRLTLRGRGVFVCISPWNFPLAIFLGQVTAALAAGNSVVAKPAEQTPLIAAAAVALAHDAGVPKEALVLVPGDGRAGAALVADKRIAGVAFTGSVEVAWAINQALAAKRGPIVPLIAETGGINAMIVDATALPEQVTDDVVTSAFRSAGQRCSALRLLCLQDDIAHRFLAMIEGGAQELRMGDPRDPATHIGPVIDRDAAAKLDAYVDSAERAGRLLWRALPNSDLQGSFVRPAIIRLERPEDLTEEVFGPILHVTTWKAGALDGLLDAIASNGTGLTLAVHSRIDAVVDGVIAGMNHGNIYVNRNMIGAVVGSQPFGGSGLSGTGPKAGGPHTLVRFALEQVVSINTAAAGGNASLLTVGGD